MAIRNTAGHYCVALVYWCHRLSYRVAPEEQGVRSKR
jgi:hypothetical protein